MEGSSLLMHGGRGVMGVVQGEWKGNSMREGTEARLCRAGQGRQVDCMGSSERGSIWLG